MILIHFFFDENGFIPSSQNDIYSIGNIIYYLLDEKNNNRLVGISEIRKDSRFKAKYHDIYEIILRCIDDAKHLAAMMQLGFIYLDYKLAIYDVNKAIYYFELVANKNERIAQYMLGIIYYDDEYDSKNIAKSIYYFQLSANQNYSEAQFYLGLIYYDKKYNTYNIDKSIYYFELTANQNHIKAQYNLGLIYYNSEDIEKDINNAIHYFSLSANQNQLEAQYALGCIYYNGKFISQDVEFLCVVLIKKYSTLTIDIIEREIRIHNTNNEIQENQLSKKNFQIIKKRI